MLLGCTSAHGGVIFGAYAVQPLAPFLQGDLTSSHAELGIMISSVLAGGAIGSIPGGWLADKSIRWTLLASQVLMGTMVLLLSRAPSFQVSLLPLFLGGLGFGALLPATAKAVALWFPLRQQAMALGILTAAAPVSIGLAAASLPTLGLAWGWRNALLPVAALTLSCGVATTALYRDPEGPRTPGIVGEGRERASSWGIIKKRDMWLLGLMAVFLGAAEHSFRTYLLLYLNEVALVPVVLGGWYLAMGHGSSLFGRIGWGVVSDRWFAGRRKGVFAMLSLLAALSIFVLGSSWAPGWSWPLLALLFGLTGGGWVGLWQAMLSERATSGSAGREIGVGLTFAYGGAILGPTLFGRGVDLANGHYGLAWTVLAFTTALAIPLALLLREESRPR